MNKKTFFWITLAALVIFAAGYVLSYLALVDIHHAQPEGLLTEWKLVMLFYYIAAPLFALATGIFLIVSKKDK